MMRQSTQARRGRPTEGGKRKRGRAGQQQRQRRLARTNGLCEMCLKTGRIARAVEVDHIKPLALGGEDVDDNTRNLCEEHHRQVTAEAFGYRRKVRVDVEGWPSQ